MSGDVLATFVSLPLVNLSRFGHFSLFVKVNKIVGSFDVSKQFCSESFTKNNEQYLCYFCRINLCDPKRTVVLPSSVSTSYPVHRIADQTCCFRFSESVKTIEIWNDAEIENPGLAFSNVYFSFNEIEILNRCSALEDSVRKAHWKKFRRN